MKLHKLQSLTVSENRQRQEFDPAAHEELKNSLESVGLMHALVVREEGDKIILVAGERRLKAFQDIYALGGHVKYNNEELPVDMVPTVTLGELDELEAEEAELDENLKRRDLTWQELASAHARLHALRQKQKAGAVISAMEQGVLQPGTPIPSQSIADTAQEIHGRSDGAYQDTVRKELIVSRHLGNPEVAKAKSVDEAFKILKRSEAAEKNRELAAEVGASFTADLHRVIKEDCLEWMGKAIDSGEQFDVILTDPPYGMDADQFGDGGGKLNGITHQYNDSHPAWTLLMSQWAGLSFCITKPEAHAYVFCDIDRFHELKRFMQAAGWYVFRTPLIDFKTDSGRVPLPDRGPRRQWEMILYAIKGNKPVTHIYPDVIPCTADETMTHGAQKPVALYVNLLKRSVKSGDKVLDTFGGSGTLIPAAHALLCEATVIEQVPEYYGMCLTRLKALKEAKDPLSALLGV
jgi:DNA modification methylase/ParB-like chromosome segregation protein Spo0J